MKFFLGALLLPWLLSSHGPTGSAAAWQDSFDPSGGFFFGDPIDSPFLYRFTASLSGNVTKIHLWVTDFGTVSGTNMLVSMYDGSRGLQTSDAVHCGASGNWFEITLGSPFPVVAGTTYGIGFSGAQIQVAANFAATEDHTGDPWYVAPNPFPVNPVTVTHGVGVYIVP